MSGPGPRPVILLETLAPPPGVSCAGIEKGPHSLRPAGTSDGPRPILERLQDEAWRATRCPAPFHPVSEASPRVSIIKSPVVVLRTRHKISVANLEFRTLRCEYGGRSRDRDTIPDALPVPQRTDPPSCCRSRGGRPRPRRHLPGVSGHGCLAACDPIGPGSIALSGDFRR